MPIETALVLAAIVAVFATFGAALAWADHCTRRTNRP
jgi:multisubunit Na+/H+ antiporter MnhC subunit